MGAFALVIVAGIVVISLVANQTTTNQLRQFMFRGEMVQLQQFADELAAYYAARGNWDGVNALFRDGGSATGGMMHSGTMEGMMGMSSSHVLLADPRGLVVADSAQQPGGQVLDSTTLASGTPIRVDGQIVGTLVVEGDMMSGALDVSAQEFLNQVNRSLLLAGIITGILALALGFVLFRQITKPLGALAAASDKIAAGDLTARAAVPGEDEIARVGRSFNAMADQLARSETARRNMLADIAHELRNPIGVISSHLEAMQDGVFPIDAEHIASLQEETFLLRRLVDDLRELALAEAGQLQLTREATDLHGLIEKTAAVFQPQAIEHDITLTTELANDIPPLNLDAQRIEQVLGNLLANALRYTPAKGKVFVKLTRTEDRARVEVRDTGSGIAPAALPHVFERFRRGDEASKALSRAYEGTGLGLAIAKQWVEAHGGEIGVESRVNQGATFWFTLPL